MSSVFFPVPKPLDVSTVAKAGMACAHVPTMETTTQTKIKMAVSA